MDIRRPDSFEHRRVSLSEIEMHYVREGSGTPLVLVHGWPGFWWEWHRVIGPLAKDLDVIAIDMRGYGASEKPDLSRFELFHTDRAVQDLADFIEALDLTSPVLVGHDYGSIVLHKFVRKHRDLVDSAVIINPVVPGFDDRYMSAGHFAESWYAKFHQLHMAVEVVSSSREACRAYYRHFLRHWTSAKTLPNDEEIEVYVDNFMEPGNVHGGFNFYRAGQQGTFNNLDHTISDLRVAFLQGLDDPCVPSAWTDLVTHWYNNYTIEYVPDCGHFMMHEKPDFLIDRVRRFCCG